MSALEIAAFSAAGFALLRLVLGIPCLVGWLLRARVSRIPRGPTPPLSLLKPLYGAEPGLEENLVATLRQNYFAFETLFLHERAADPALAAASAAAALVPDVPARFVAGREEGIANPKIAVLARGEAEAHHEILVSADSDVRPDPLWLRDVANGLVERDVVFLPPVLFGMRTAAARILALFVNVDGLLTLLLARGRIVLGATIGVRREALRAIGGFRAVGDRIADDIDLGLALRRAGHPAAVGRRAARCHTPEGGLRETSARIARWSRTARGAAPLAFLLSLPASFAPLLLLAAASGPRGTTALLLLLAQTLLRAAVALAIDFRFCWDRSLAKGIPLLPALWIVEPLASLAGLLLRTVEWRGRRYRLRGGRATLPGR
jgi:ceramide glucosyltransferase